MEDAEAGKSLAATVSRLKEGPHGVNHVFCWHALSGYWGGVSVDADDDIAAAAATADADACALEGPGSARCDPAASSAQAYASPTPHLREIEPNVLWDPASIVGVGAVPAAMGAIYGKMHSYLSRAGVDGVKVDAQVCGWVEPV